MEFNDFQAEARRTSNGEPSLIICALGLCGESGEFAEHIKKVAGHGHDLDREKLIYELGDILWYVAMASDALGVTMAHVASMNQLKLRERYPNGFEAERSRNRGKVD